MAKRIGELLVEGGILSQSQLEQALFAQRKDGRKLGLLLVELGLVNEVQVTQTLSRQLSVPWVSLYHVDFSRSLLNLVPHETAEKHGLVPIFVRRTRKQGETLYVAMDDPTNETAIQEVSRATSLPVKRMIACPTDIRAAIRVYYLGETLPVVPAPPPSAPVSIARPPQPPPPQSGPGPLGAVSADRPVATNAGAADSPDASPEVQAEEKEFTAAPRKARAKMFSLTLLDGTTISLPSPPKKHTDAPAAVAQGESAIPRKSPPGEVLSDQLTARDLVSALRAVAHGADASEILGAEPGWEGFFSALLSVLLRKGLIADWEFVEEFRKI